MKVKQTKEQEMILEGGLWNMMWCLSWPAVIAMVLFGLNVVIDGIFVGRYVGESALAGITLVYPVTQFLQGIGSLIGVGAGSYLSVLIGRKALEEQRKLIGNVNFLILSLSVLASLLGFICLKPLLHILGASTDQSAIGIRYIYPILFGSVFWIAGLAYNMVIRAEGKMKTAAWMMGIGLLCNIMFNYILMAIFKLGVLGAALGTNIGMMIYTLSFFFYAAQKKASFNLSAFSIRKDSLALKQILSLGFPSLLMTIMYVIQSLVIVKSLSTYGSAADVAFYGSVFRLFNLFLSPIYGLMRALQPAIGMNYGAQNYERVIKTYKVFAFSAFIMMLPLWLISMFSPTSVLSMMLPGRSFLDSEIFNFRIFVSVAPFLPIVFTAMTFYPAINKPKPAAILGISRQLFLYIPAMSLLPKYFGISWIYKGSFLIDLSLCVVISLMILKEFNAMRTLKRTVEEAM